ncbi:MAG: hypothetical protein HY080_09205 [Gammaproteobacteria bacterium]|nr:hypothetical protein [Gammaproteobacteria bacterium]
MPLTTKPIPGGIALELTMRDVMESLTDTAAAVAFANTTLSVQILSLDTPISVALPGPRPDNVIQVRKNRSHDVVEYLLRRETRLLRQAKIA